MRKKVSIVAGMFILVTFMFLGSDLNAAEPDSIKVTIGTDTIFAAVDGVYRVSLEAAGSSGYTSPSSSEPTSEDFALEKGNLVAFSREFAFKDPEFTWKLTVVPPSEEGTETRPMILSGEISPSNIDELMSPSAQTSFRVSSSAYIQSQPPSHGIEIGDTPVMIKLSVFSARMNACSGLDEGFDTGDYSVNIWMDGNSNHLREPSEEESTISRPDANGKLCVPMELRSFTEEVDYEYELIDSQGLSVGLGKGSYNFGTNSIGGEFPEAKFRWTGVGFHGSAVELEVKLTNPFKAFMTETDRVETFKEPTDLCTRRLPNECPDIAVAPPTSLGGIPSKSYWDQWPDKFKGNKAYIPLLGLLVGILGVGLQLRRRRQN